MQIRAAMWKVWKSLRRLRFGELFLCLSCSSSNCRMLNHLWFRSYLGHFDGALHRRCNPRSHVPSHALRPADVSFLMKLQQPHSRFFA